MNIHIRTACYKEHRQCIIAGKLYFYFYPYLFSFLYNGFGHSSPLPLPTQIRKFISELLSGIPNAYPPHGVIHQFSQNRKQQIQLQYVQSKKWTSVEGNECLFISNNIVHRDCRAILNGPARKPAIFKLALVQFIIRLPCWTWYKLKAKFSIIVSTEKCVIICWFHAMTFCSHTKSNF
jgi:hypothetical protein